MEHFVDIVIVDCIMELLSNSLEFLKVNNSIIIFVEKSKDTTNSVLGLCFTNSWSNSINELIKSNRFVLISQAIDQVQYKRISAIKTKFLQHFVDFDWVDSSTVILIEDPESINKLIIILSCKTILPGGGNRLVGLTWSGGWFYVASDSAHLSIIRYWVLLQI